MADEDSKGQLLFDLIAPLPSRPSAFEEAAWAAAAASVRERSGPTGRTDASPAADPGKIPSEPVPPDSEARKAGSALFVVPPADDEPPLAPSDSSRGPDGSGPGPRVAAFAAATGAATRSGVVTRESSPFTSAHPAAGQEPSAPDTRATPDEDRAAPTTPASPASPAQSVAAGPDAPSSESFSGPEEVAQGPAAADVQADAGTGKETTPGLPPLEHDEDFGPLILVEKPRRRRRAARRPNAATPANEGGTPKHPGGKHRQARAGLLLAAALAVVASVAGWWVFAGRGQPAADPPAAAAPVPDVSMVAWHGMELPVSRTAGPSTFADTAVGGFTHSALGAAIAAAHLVVRTDPVAGAEVFEPVLATQVVGAGDRLAEAVRTQAAQTPAPSTPGTLLGWRLDGDPLNDQLVAHLAVDEADGSRLDFAVPLAWADGDWRIDAPAQGDFFPVTDLSGDYSRFIGEGTVS